MGEVSFNFKDKVVLITGSAGNIGSKTAQLFAESGAQVVIVDINQEGIRTAAQTCKNLSPLKYEPLEIVADVSKQDDLKRIIDTTIGKFGKLDVLINNVGLGISQRIYDEKAIEVFDQIMNINLKSFYVLTHLAVPYLSKTKGSIVNLSSVQSSRTLEYYGAYGISKAGIDMLTKNSAIELGPMNIRVNAVNPGHIWPPLMASENAKKVSLNWVEKNYPLRRYGQPEDVAKVILFLSSNGAQFITGANIPIDSGLRSFVPGFDSAFLNE